MDKRNKIVMKQLKTVMYVVVAAIVVGLFAGVLHADPKPVKKEPVKVTKQSKPAAEPVKKEHKKKPTLKKKYADKK
jgi:predicted histidine transporter YuiF (NhaC family)